MTKAELIKKLDNYDDDIEIIIAVNPENLQECSGMCESEVGFVYMYNGREIIISQ